MNKSRNIIGVIGKTGTGKSELLKSYILQKIESYIIMDLLGEYEAGESFSGINGKFLKAFSEKSDGKYIIKVTSELISQNVFIFSRNIKHPHTLVVEEVSNYCSPYTIDSNLAEIIRYGRHWGINIIWAAQRAADISRLLTSQTDLLISFQQSEKIDIHALKFCSDAAKKLPDLNKYEFIPLAVSEKYSNIFAKDEIQTLNLKTSKIEKVKNS